MVQGLDLFRNDKIRRNNPLVATRRKRKKVQSYKRLPSIQLNVGTIMFGILFIYLIINIIIYATTSHATVYSVTAGPLAKTHQFTTLAVREETVVNAEKAGNIHYYAREGEKVGKNKEVYSIDEGGRLKELLAEDSNNGLTPKDYIKIKEQIADYAYLYKNTEFFTIYNFKSEIEGNILELLSQNTLSQINDLSQKEGQGNLFTISTAPEEGVVVYSQDGLENLTPDTVSEDLFTKKDYEKVSLRKDGLVDTGESAYKLITSEDWSLILPLDDKTIPLVKDKDQIRFKFLKDSVQGIGSFHMFESEGKTYGQINLSSGMVRYATDRYLDIELLLDHKNGLKIPNTAIVEKQFFIIPKEYKMQGGNSNEAGFLRERYLDGSTSTQFIPTTIYYEEEGLCYIDTTTFQDGDYIVLPDSTQRYQLSQKQSLQGVYNVNKGYAVFNQIKILDQNEEYCIVANNTLYGLSQYDHIILNGKSVEEEDIVY